MFYLSGTVLNNAGLEQVYLYLSKHYTLIVKTATVVSSYRIVRWLLIKI